MQTYFVLDRHMQKALLFIQVFYRILKAKNIELFLKTLGIMLARQKTTPLLIVSFVKVKVICLKAASIKLWCELQERTYKVVSDMVVAT